MNGVEKGGGGGGFKKEWRVHEFTGEGRPV